jgi:outer membrane receptor for monomeric catechols
MKTLLQTLAVALPLVFVSSAFANQGRDTAARVATPKTTATLAASEQQTAVGARKESVAATEQVTVRRVTGTRIARPVRRIGNTYDTAQPIQIIDGKDLRSRGAMSADEALRNLSFVGR